MLARVVKQAAWQRAGHVQKRNQLCSPLSSKDSGRFTISRRDTTFVTASLLGEAVVVGSTAAALLSIARSFVPRKKRLVPTDEDTGLQWGLMGLISCLPLFSWMGWILAGMQAADEYKRLYYATALIYLAPIFTSGLEINRFSLLMVVLCIINVQAERVAVTEPETFAILTNKSSLFEYIKKSFPTLGENAQSENGSLENGLASASQQELEDFDAQLRERSLRKSPHDPT